MPRLDYYAIEEEIERIILADSTMEGVTVGIEDDPDTMERCPWVSIYLQRRDAPADIQRISAGQQTHFQLRFSILCWGFSLESKKKAAQMRDDLLGKVELVLMNNRTIGEKVSFTHIDGGDMATDRTNEGFGSVGEIVLTAEAKTSTT